MNEAKWISLDDQTKTCLISATKEFCTNELTGDTKDEIGIRVDGRSVSTVRRKLKSIVDLGQCDDAGVIAVVANEKLREIVPFVEARKPERLYEIDSTDYTYCKRVALFFKHYNKDNVDSLIFNNYGMNTYDLSNYYSTSGIMYIYTHRDEFSIRKSTTNGKWFAMHNTVIETLLEKAKKTDISRAKDDTQNMTEFLRTKGITGFSRVASLLGTSDPSALIDEKRIDKQMLMVIEQIDKIQKDLTSLQFAKQKLSTFGGGKKLKAEFGRACKQMVNEVYDKQ